MPKSSAIFVLLERRKAPVVTDVPLEAGSPSGYPYTCNDVTGDVVPIPALPVVANEDNVPTEVSEDAVTPDARVAPVNVPAGATTALVEAAVIRPLALTVNAGMAVEEPKLPTLPFTVANVIARLPAEFVTSPVCAGSCAACNVPEA